MRVNGVCRKIETLRCWKGLKQEGNCKKDQRIDAATDMTGKLRVENSETMLEGPGFL